MWNGYEFRLYTVYIFEIKAVSPYERDAMRSAMRGVIIFWFVSVFF